MHNILGGSVQTLIRYFLLPNVLLCYIKALMPTYGYLSMAVLAPHPWLFQPLSMAVLAPIHGFFYLTSPYLYRASNWSLQVNPSGFINLQFHSSQLITHSSQLHSSQLIASQHSVPYLRQNLSLPLPMVNRVNSNDKR